MCYAYFLQNASHGIAGLFDTAACGHRNLAPLPHRMHQPCVDAIMSNASFLPNYQIKCTLALKYDSAEQLENHPTLQRYAAAAQRLESPNGCQEQYVHSNTTLV
jgi:hypothetical protein